MLLIAKGYRIMARRCKKPVGEINIVARRQRDLDAAAEALTKHGKRRIVAAAEFWLASHPGDAEKLDPFRRDLGRARQGAPPRRQSLRCDALNDAAGDASGGAQHAEELVGRQAGDGQGGKRRRGAG